MQITKYPVAAETRSEWIICFESWNLSSLNFNKVNYLIWKHSSFEPLLLFGAEQFYYLSQWWLKRCCPHKSNLNAPQRLSSAVCSGSAGRKSPFLGGAGCEGAFGSICSFCYRLMRYVTELRLIQVIEKNGQILVRLLLCSAAMHLWHLGNGMRHLVRADGGRGGWVREEERSGGWEKGAAGEHLLPAGSQSLPVTLFHSHCVNAW